MRDHDGGKAKLGLQGAEFQLQPIARDRVERAEGLVHQQEVGPAGQGAGKTDALALAAGNLAGIAVRIVGGWQLDQVQHLVGAGADIRRWPAQQARHDGDILAHGEMGEQAVALHHPADLPAQRHRVEPGDIAPLIHDRTARSLLQAVDQFQHGGLAAAGFAGQGQQFAALDPEGEAAHGLHPAGIGLADRPDVENGTCRLAQRSSRSMSRIVISKE